MFWKDQCKILGCTKVHPAPKQGRIRNRRAEINALYHKGLFGTQALESINRKIALEQVEILTKERNLLVAESKRLLVEFGLPEGFKTELKQERCCIEKNFQSASSEKDIPSSSSSGLERSQKSPLLGEVAFGQVIDAASPLIGSDTEEFHARKISLRHQLEVEIEQPQPEGWVKKIYRKAGYI